MKAHRRILLLLLIIIMTVAAVPMSTNAEEYDLLESREAAAELPVWLFRSAQGKGTYTITTSVLNVRAAATTDSEKLGQVYSGQTYVVTAVSGNWGKITYEGKAAWICLDYAQLNAPKKMTISDNGLALIKKYEGYRKYKYWDYNHYSIGYGTTCGANDYPNGVTEAEATQMLKNTLVKSETYLDSFLAGNGITVSQNQYDALVSFTYNLGNPWERYDSFELKTILIKGINKYTSTEVYEAFGQFVKAGGQVLPGLVDRRNAEAALFLSGNKLLPFGDVKSSNWFFNAVQTCYNKGIMSGVSSYRFEPYSTLTRAQMVAMLGQMTGINTSTYKKSEFSDVSTSSWYFPYVRWAQLKGIVSGTGNGKFSPNAPLTRQDMVVMLYNYTKAIGKNVGGVSQYLYYKYSDYIYVSKYAVTAMNWAIKNECISGSSGKLLPGSYATRAQVAQVAANYYSKVLGK